MAGMAFGVCVGLISARMGAGDRLAFFAGAAAAICPLAADVGIAMLEDRRVASLRASAAIAPELRDKTLIVRSPSDEASLAIGSMAFFQWIAFEPLKVITGAIDSITEPLSALVDNRRLFPTDENGKAIFFKNVGLTVSGLSQVLLGLGRVVLLGILICVELYTGVLLFAIASTLTLFLVPLILASNLVLCVAVGREVFLLGSLVQLSVEPTPPGRWHLHVIEPECPGEGEITWSGGYGGYAADRTGYELKHAIANCELVVVDHVIKFVCTPENDPEAFVDRRRVLFERLSGRNNAIKWEELRLLANHLRDRWKAWQGEDSLEEMAFGEPVE
jgi:hypothetical protein